MLPVWTCTKVPYPRIGSCRLATVQLVCASGANAVIVMVDPTRKWTFDYAKQEITKVPKGVDILLLVRELPMRIIITSGFLIC